VNKVTSVSLGYPLPVFNKNSTLKERKQEKKTQKEGRERVRKIECEQEKETHEEVTNSRMSDLELFFIDY